jgi:hypothetical protein
MLVVFNFSKVVPMCDKFETGSRCCTTIRPTATAPRRASKFVTQCSLTSAYCTLCATIVCTRLAACSRATELRNDTRAADFARSRVDLEDLVGDLAVDLVVDQAVDLTADLAVDFAVDFAGVPWLASVLVLEDVHITCLLMRNKIKNSLQTKKVGGFFSSFSQ